MKQILSFYKKLAVIFITAIFTVLCTGVDSYAELPDVKILGGSYGKIRDQVYDTSKFHAHHLISREAWKRLGDAIVNSYGVTFYNEFITDDYYQNWAPAILMEKEDHKKTRSYYSTDRAYEASAYINYETNQLFEKGAVIQLLNDECADIRTKFGSKYDKAIAQMFASIKGQFRHQENILFIRDLETGYYVRYKFGCMLDTGGYVRWIA